MGALSPRLVCMDFAVPWLLQCPKVSEEPCPLPQDTPPTTADITPEAPPSSSDLTLKALPISHKPPLKRPLDQPDDDGVVPPAKRTTMETVAMEMEESSAEAGRVKTSLPHPLTSNKEEVVHSDGALALCMGESLIKEENMTVCECVCVYIYHNHVFCPHSGVLVL